MGAGSGGSAMLDLKAGPMRAHDYTTLFKLEHMLKDVRLCLDSGQAAGVGFPAAADAREVLSAAMGRDLGRRGLRRAARGRRGRRRATALRKPLDLQAGFGIPGFREKIRTAREARVGRPASRRGFWFWKLPL